MSIVRLFALGLGLALSLTGHSATADSEFEYIRVESEALGRKMMVGIYLPAGYRQSSDRYPTLYFLHGMFGSERKWEGRGIPEQLDELIESGAAAPMIVICPNGENSMYVNWANGKADWEGYLTRELVAAVDQMFRTDPRAEARGITGDSMGGYGALNLAFQHSNIFGSVSAHSAALYSPVIDELPDWVREQAKRWGNIFGDPVDEGLWRRNNPLYLAETTAVETLRSLNIYFDCGKQDRFGFADSNSQLSEILKRREVPHQFALRDGGHGREYYTRYASLSLGFHSELFAKSAATAQREAEARRDV